MNEPMMPLQPRIRANFTQNAKGIASLDVTVEAGSVEEIKEYMGKATDEVVKLLEQRQIQVSHKVN